MKRLILSAVIMLCAPRQGAATVLLSDPFDSFDIANVWEPGNGMTIQGMLPYWDKYQVTYAGPINTATPTTIDMRTVVRLWSDLGELQRNAYRTRQAFEGLIEVRAELVFLPIGNEGSIDGIVELGFLNTTTGDQLHVGIWGGQWGRDRFAYAASEVEDVYEMASGWIQDEPSDDWQYDQWYRFIIEADVTQTLVSMQEEGGTEIWTHTFGVGIDDLGDFNLTLSQSLGRPLSGNWHPESAVDHLSLTGTVIPEPSTIIIWSLISLSFAGVVWRRRRRQTHC